MAQKTQSAPINLKSVTEPEETSELPGKLLGNTGPVTTFSASEASTQIFETPHK